MRFEIFIVYKHTSPSNKVYIGITSKTPSKRWQSGNGYKNNKYFFRAIKKYGWENFKHEILFEGLTEEQANIIEQMQINYYDSTNKKKGYNISLGGGAMTGRKHSDESKHKMSESAKGRKCYWEGKTFSDEHKRHLSDSHKGQHQSNDTKQKRAKKLKGHYVNVDSICKRVLKISNAGCVLEEYESITKAAESISNIHATSHISECCKGKRKTAGGFQWKYKEK